MKYCFCLLKGKNPFSNKLKKNIFVCNKLKDTKKLIACRALESICVFS